MHPLLLLLAEDADDADGMTGNDWDVGICGKRTGKRW